MQITGRMTAGREGWGVDAAGHQVCSSHGTTHSANSATAAVGGGGHQARGVWAGRCILLRLAAIAALAVATAAATMGGGGSGMLAMMAVGAPETVPAGGGAARHRSLNAASGSKAGALGRSRPLCTRPSHSRPALAPCPRLAPETPVDTNLATRHPLGVGGDLRTAPAREATASPRRPSRLGVDPPVRDGDPPD
jgi:hypothetical protein